MSGNPIGMTPGKGSFQGGSMMNTPGKNDSSLGGGNSLGLAGIQLQVLELVAKWFRLFQLLVILFSPLCVVGSPNHFLSK